jgi:outer membrane protein OmpA-like peptidoglycan-associated protein
VNGGDSADSSSNPGKRINETGRFRVKNGFWSGKDTTPMAKTDRRDALKSAAALKDANVRVSEPGRLPGDRGLVVSFRVRSALVLVACLFLLALSADVRADEIGQIPLQPGMTVVFAVADPAGDHEPSFEISAVAPDHYEGLFSSEVDDARTGRRRTIEIPRRVRMQDHREARIIRSEFWEGDPLTYSGTTPFLSRAIIEELRRGSSTITDQNVGSMFGLPVPRNRRGTLTRVAFEKFPVIVNGQLTDLRVIRARGELRDQTTDQRETVEVIALDDLANPLYLAWREAARSSRIVRIDYPSSGAARARLEAALADRKPLDVYSVYFSFASATLRPQSIPTLEDIAAVLRKHPEWKLSIQGHTDNVGSDAANLELSEQRAGAVRDALIRQYGIAPDRLASGGSGASSPIAKNDSPEGRARNRRVVLTRS